MNLDTISHQLDRIRQKTYVLDSDGVGSAQLTAALREAVEELGVAFEELRVVGEELSRQEEEIRSLRASLVSERDRFFELFEFAPDGYLVTDPYGRIGDANRAAAEILNVPSEHLAGSPMAGFISPVTRGRFRHEIDLLRSIDREGELMVLLQPRDREPIRCALRASVARDRDGRAIAYRWLVRNVGDRDSATGEPEIPEMLEQQIDAHAGSGGVVSDLMREIDEHVQIESSLLENETIYRAIVEHAMEATALARADGTLLFASAATFGQLGIDPVDVIGHNLFDALHPRDRESAAELVNILLLTPESAITTEVRLRHADRTWRRLAVRAVNLLGIPFVNAIMIYFRHLGDLHEQIRPDVW
jgi:PAS domain S-box-containing protein